MAEPADSLSQPAAASSARTRCLIAIAVGVSVLVFTRLRGELWFYRVFHAWLNDLGIAPHIRNLDASLWLVAAAIFGAWIAGHGQPLKHLGLRGSLRTGMIFGLIASLPMIAQAAIASEQLQLDWSAAKGVLIAPLVEETFFRGLLVAVPVCLANMRFWPVAIASSLLFGSIHVPWNGDLATHHSWTFLITAMGGLWYAWILRVYRWNLWTTIFLHLGMNAAWLLFAVGGGAVGSGLWPNIGRGLTIVLGTVMALRHQRTIGTTNS